MLFVVTKYAKVKEFINVLAIDADKCSGVKANIKTITSKVIRFIATHLFSAFVVDMNTPSPYTTSV